MSMHCHVYTCFSMQVCIQSLEGVISSKKGEATCYYTFYLLTEKQIDSMHCISVNSVWFFDAYLHLILHLLTDAFHMLTTCIHI